MFTSWHGVKEAPNSTTVALDIRGNILKQLFYLEVSSGDRCVEVIWYWLTGTNKGWDHEYRYPALSKAVTWGREGWYALQLIDRLFEDQINDIYRLIKAGRHRRKGEGVGWYGYWDAPLEMSCDYAFDKALKANYVFPYPKRLEELQLNITYVFDESEDLFDMM